MRYNLDLLREMLHCSTKDKQQVDEATYTHVIRKWVREVRSRSTSTLSLTEEPSQEVSANSPKKKKGAVVMKVVLPSLYQDDVILDHSLSYCKLPTLSSSHPYDLSLAPRVC